MSVRRYISEQEMNQILSESCQRVAREDAEMGVIHAEESLRPMHSFVPLEKGMVLTKNGVSKREGVIRQSFSEMFSIHERAIRMLCRRNGIESDLCQIEVRYYQCDQLEVTESEGLLDSFYDQRELIFQFENQKQMKQSLEREFSPRSDSDCPLYLSLYQSLSSMNWNSRGQDEYNGMTRFLGELSASDTYESCRR